MKPRYDPLSLEEKMTVMVLPLLETFSDEFPHTMLSRGESGNTPFRTCDNNRHTIFSGEYFAANFQQHVITRFKIQTQHTATSSH